MDQHEARLVRLCGWSTFVFLALFCLGWGVLGRNIPPYGADMSAADLAAIYRQHAVSLRFGFAVGAFSTTFLATWAPDRFRRPGGCSSPCGYWSMLS